MAEKTQKPQPRTIHVVMAPPRRSFIEKLWSGLKIGGLLFLAFWLLKGFFTPTVAEVAASGPVVPVVRLSGAIGSDLTHENTKSVLEKAFNMKEAQGVVIVINSPGGSPIESEKIAAHIRRLAEKTGLTVKIQVDAIAASGGFWIAMAGDEIHASRNSILGSVGVIAAQFGYSELMEKIGIDRRVYTAGKNKSGPDPFLPEDREAIKKQKELMEALHRNFIDWVKERRAGKLNLPTGEDVFDGSIWLGDKAMKMGFIDGITITPHLFGEDVTYIDLGRGNTSKKGGLRSMVATVVVGVLDALEIRNDPLPQFLYQ